MRIYEKGWVVLISCCTALFACGFIFARLLAQYGLLPETTFLWKNDFDIGTLFNIIAALATSVAAIAAFESAKSASQTVKDSRIFASIQMSSAHYNTFENTLNDTEKHFNIKFRDRIELYDKLFPANRYPDGNFSPIADRTWLDIWNNEYDQVVDLALSNKDISDTELAEWINKCHLLEYNLNFRFTHVERGAIILYRKYLTSASNEPGKIIFQLGDVIYRLARFGLQNQAKAVVIDTNSIFVQQYTNFYNAIEGEFITEHILN